MACVVDLVRCGVGAAVADVGGMLGAGDTACGGDELLVVRVVDFTGRGAGVADGGIGGGLGAGDTAGLQDGFL